MSSLLLQKNTPVASPHAVQEGVFRCPPYVAGLSIDEIKEKYNLTNVIKLASNENPLGTAPSVQECIKRNAASAFRYPQSGNPRLVAAIAKHLNVPKESILLGNGSDEVIDLLIRTRTLPETNNVVTFKPCFAIYETQTLVNQVELRQAPLNEDFSFNWNSFLALIDDKTSLAFITTPDNPSGYCPAIGEIKTALNEIPASCLLVIDEAYMDFSSHEHLHSLLPEITSHPNVVILRTFSKSFGLAGLRLGYAIMHPELCAAIQRIRLPFSVNILVEEAGICALNDTVFYEETLRTVMSERKNLSQALTALNFYVYPSKANFIMVKPPCDAPWLFEELLRKGIIIRSLKSYNLPHLLRITIGSPQENIQLLKAIKELLPHA